MCPSRLVTFFTSQFKITVEPSVGPLTEKTVIDLCPKVDC